MNEVLTLIFFGLLCSAALHAVVRLFLPARTSAILAIVVGFAFAILPRMSELNMLFVSLLWPLPVSLAVYCGAFLVQPFGPDFKPWSRVELLIAFGLLVFLLLSGAGYLSVDVYRFGYEAVPVAIISAVIAGISFFRRKPLLLLSTLLAQLLWLAGAGSSNFFDHMLHVIYLPMLLGLLAIAPATASKTGN